VNNYQLSVISSQWSRIFFCCLLVLLCGQGVWGQKRNERFFTKNLPDYDTKRLHYGICLLGTATRFERRYSDVFNKNQDSTFSVNPKWDNAFGVGLLISYNLAEHWDLRFSPVVHFYGRTLNYTFANSTNTQLIESSFLEFPLLFKYKSVRRGNVRMYMIGGIKPGVEINQRKKESDAKQLRTQSLDLSVEYGFGFDLYYTYFKFSPELRFSHGLQNMVVDDNSVFSRSLSRLTSHNVTLYLYFE
jgi:hypothetical protein